MDRWAEEWEITWGKIGPGRPKGDVKGGKRRRERLTGNPESMSGKDMRAPGGQKSHNKQRRGKVPGDPGGKKCRKGEKKMEYHPLLIP